ncbi:MAG: DUF4363 family protein [Christensenellales bacterium]
MKRGFIIIILFVLLLGLCGVEEYFLSSNLKELQRKTENLIKIVDETTDVNDNIVIEKINDLDKFWTKTENYFCIIVSHINMEEAGEQISKIKTLSNQNKKDELMLELDLLLYYAKSYTHILIPSIQNIL